MDVLLNEVTHTVHKYERDKSDFQTECGIHHHLSHDNLQPTSDDQLLTAKNASKCGRCFDGEGGY
ncbi:hypothetical protein AArcSl_0388 [Halalkaliarchaeum desulfuricum]|uniref:Uncharacterized protein n=1 Tax=Halalkaliarchaeum desulfuricum TaxID=2055893 RepID=A0A343TG19_9EURY|nr:hypothetical protein AArcSl_0388 [Halalkaliarchaeum desulfuricum]